MPPFRSDAQRRYLFANKPTIARAIATDLGAKIGGGKTAAQKSRRASAAGQGKTYKPR